MPRPFTEIASDFDSLTPRDFDYAIPGAQGWQRLEELCDELQIMNDPAICAPLMFRTMERLADEDLGTPGPLVHTLETWRGRYEELVAESVRRKPTPLSIWMVGRILNARPADSESWMALLQGVSDNPAASVQTKDEAKHT